ncbi:MAG: hypothetical protein ACI9MR_001308 [Myxococcota bacterium]|jgi:hypothetical protein
MNTRILAAFSAVVSLGLLMPSIAQAVPDGAYLGIGLGGALASGDRGVPLKLSQSSTQFEEVVRTDFGSGMAFELRFGYLIAGVLAPEISLGGHGNLDFEDGAGYPVFVLRYHPIQHAIDHADRAWDINLYGGVGYAIGGYQPDTTPSSKSKGWEGIAMLVGGGFAYQLADSVSLALDLRVVLPQYNTFLIDRDDDIEADAEDTPSTTVIIPTLQVVFHL